MTDIHPSAIVDPKAELADGVTVGPWCQVEAGAVIGAGTELEASVTVRGGTTIGERCRISHHAIVGGDPQDKRWDGSPTRLEIGDENVIREYVSIHRANSPDEATILGSRNYLMAYCHIGHNSVLEDDVTLTNYVGVSGHVHIESGVTVGGLTGLHQFVRIGQLAMVGGMSRIVRDVPPFCLVEGNPAEVRDINAVGLRRRGVKQEARTALHKAVKILCKSKIPVPKAVEIVKREVPMQPEVELLIEAMERVRGGRMGRSGQR